MAPLPTIADTFRCALRWHHSDLGTDAVNVMHLRNTSSDPVDLAVLLEAHVTPSMWLQTDQHARIVQVDITPLDGGSASYSYVPPPGETKWAGPSTLHTPMPQVAALVKFVTGKRGRSARGRLYLPWMIEDAYANGVYDSATRGAQQIAWSTFHTDLISAGTEIVVASYVNSSAENVTGLIVEQFSATQRRRLKRSSL